MAFEFSGLGLFSEGEVLVEGEVESKLAIEAIVGQNVKEGDNLG